MPSIELILMDKINCKSQYFQYASEFPSKTMLPWGTCPSVSGETWLTPPSSRPPPMTLVFFMEDLQGDHFCYPPNNNPLVTYTTPGHAKSLATKNPIIWAGWGWGGEHLCMQEPFREPWKYWENPF